MPAARRLNSAQNLIARTKLGTRADVIKETASGLMGTGAPKGSITRKPSRLQMCRPVSSMMPNSVEMLKQRGEELEKAFNESRILNFDNKYVLGEKLGEGQHASVYKCFKRIQPRTTTDDSTPLLAK
jgi:hypothetical protein